MAGVRRDALVAGAFSMAGADWPEDFDLLQAAMEQRGFGRRILVVNDAIGGLRAGSPDGMGVAVVCGTGAGTGAHAPDGRVWHTSFWQEPNGSHDLARRMLRGVYRAELGIDPPTMLTRRVLDFLGQSTVEDVLHLFTRREGQRPTQLGGL
jgi:N-acetylglucosamine kinase-like BadF-type ATPase